MKKICSVLLALAMVLSCIGMLPAKAQAADASVLTFTLSEDGSSYIVSDCDDTAAGELTVPATHEGKPVTEIGTAAFRNCAALTAIVLPESIRSIGNAAFSHCTGLVSVNIPDGVTSINSDTFYRCTSLAEITIPDGVTVIAPYAFYYCTSLTSVTIPSSVTVIGTYAFSFCSSLVTVNMQAKLTKISAGVFYKCRALQSITIPNGVTAIEELAFDSCLVLLNVGIPASVTAIGDSAFGNMSNLFFVYYCGSQEQWSQISIGSGNESLANASHSFHKFVGGDCESAQICAICGENGPNGHRWVIGTCTTAHYCSVCNAVVSEAPGHSWKTATCTDPETCAACGETRGEALGHTWVDATCTTPKTCTTCGETKGTIKHTYDDSDDHLCNLCGYERTLSDASLVFVGSTGLSFQDYIGMQVLTSSSFASKYDKLYLTAVQTTPDGNVTTTLTGKPYYGVYLMFEQQVMSWSMTEEVTLTLCAQKDGKTYVGQSIKASVQDLAMTKLASYTNQGNTKAVTALVDMLHYGAAVQVAFNHNASNLPNAGEYEEMGTTAEPAFNAVNEITGEGTVPVAKDSISMQAKVEIQLLFMVDVSAYTVSAKIGDADAPVVVDTKTYGAWGWTLVKVAVGAAKMRDTFTISLVDAEGVSVTKVYNVSIEAYAQSQVGGTYHDVVVAMMRYGDSVAAI